MPSKPILLVLGAGSNVGKALATRFSAAGYNVAFAARSITNGTSPEGHLSIKADLSEFDAVPSIFAKVKETLGASPSTVIYNAAALTPPPNSSNIFSVPEEALERDMKLMNTNAFIAAREAVAGFEALPAETKKTFIYTGNCLNTKILPVPALVTLGVGKSAAASWIGLASATFASKGYK
jgi:NAD(P)-dependent dehydrogenase (short-subunit alcohol dehydrogenase family)